VAVLSGSSNNEVVVGGGAVSGFFEGDLLAVDVNYADEVGYVGSGIAAAYVKDAADVHHDADYVRRVTFNLGRVAEKTATSLLLTQPLLGGSPPSGARVQKVVAFVDREGGSFFQEWSALFITEEESGGRVCFYYPRLSPQQSGTFVREPSVEIVRPLSALALRGSFLALPYTDDNDGQTVVCYRSYFPSAMSAIY
jgi:hypothetical protein